MSQDAESTSGLAAAGVAVLLLVFGLAAFLGTALSGPVADRAPLVGVFLFPAVLGVGMLVLLVAGGSSTGLFTAAALWGLGFGGVPTTVLNWGARTELARLEQIGGLLVTVCNVAIAVGAVVGGVLVDGVSASSPVLVGGVASIAGAAVLGTLRRRG